MAGQHRIGKYLAEKTLGAGSFATVWLAFDELLEAHVAIKVLADNWARHADVRRRFIEEARWLRRIDHDRVIRVHDIDELEDGRPYFVMNHADRGTLHDLLKARPAGDPLPLDDAFSLAGELCEALSIVHDWDLVHRDVKPSNVLFRSVRNHERAAALREGRYVRDEAVVVGDFGLAKDLAVASGFTLAAGTPAYMAPEQAYPTAVIDHRVDVFAVAAVIYELFAGQQAFRSDTLSGVRSRRDDTAVTPVSSLRPDAPAGLDDVLVRGMARAPEDRTSSCALLGAELAALWQASRQPTPAVRVATPLPPPVTVVGTPSPPAEHDARQTPQYPEVVELTGLAGRVSDLAMGAKDVIGDLAVAGVAARLSRSHRIAVLGQPGAVRAHVASALRQKALVEELNHVDQGTIEQALAADAVAWIVRADRIVSPESETVAAQLKSISESPFAVEILSTTPDGSAADFSRAQMDQLTGPSRALMSVAVPANAIGIDSLIGLLGDQATSRSVAMRASTGLRLLTQALKQAPSSPARTVALDRVEQLQQEAPLILELDMLRTLVAGRVTLPPWLRAELLRLFTHLEPSRRLGLPADATPQQLRAAVEALSNEWRIRENTNRIPFSARAALLIGQQSLDRLHAELSAFT